MEPAAITSCVCSGRESRAGTPVYPPWAGDVLLLSEKGKEHTGGVITR
jgi:hypothetical protein